MKTEIRKAAKAVTIISDSREQIRTQLDRNERVRNLLDDASVEIACVLRIAME